MWQKAFFIIIYSPLIKANKKKFGRREPDFKLRKQKSPTKRTTEKLDSAPSSQFSQWLSSSYYWKLPIIEKLLKNEVSWVSSIFNIIISVTGTKKVIKKNRNSQVFCAIHFIRTF